MARPHTRFDARWLSARLPALPAGSCYRVALSGGADSCALAAAVAELAAAGELAATALHVNHGVHPDADLWQQHCQSLCDRLGLPFTSVRVNPDPDSPSGPEAEWRRCRYAAFNAALNPGDVLLTAHHRDDQAETVLLHLARSSGPEGLAAIPKERLLGSGKILRPLLEVTPDALRSYCQARDIDWISDPSNDDDGLDRGYLRRAVMPVLRTRWPAIDATLAEVARLQSEAAEGLRYAAQPSLDQRLHNGLVMPLSAIPQAPASLLPLVIREWVREAGLAPIPRNRLRAFCEQLASARNDSRVTLEWDNSALRLFRDALWLTSRKMPEPPTPQHWVASHPLEAGPDVGSLVIESPRPLEDWPPFRVSFRAGGERFAPGGGRPRRAVKDLLREAGIPPWLRTRVPLISDDGGLVAIADTLVAERLRHRLDASDARLVWRPADTVLAALHAQWPGAVKTVSVPLETTSPLG